LPPAERRTKGAARAQLVDTIYRIMTNPDEDAVALAEQRSTPAVVAARRRDRAGGQDAGIRRCPTSASMISPVSWSTSREFGGKVNLHELSRDLQMRADDLIFEHRNHPSKVKVGALQTLRDVCMRLMLHHCYRIPRERIRQAIAPVVF
jgi:hypothetical protein